MMRRDEVRSLIEAHGAEAFTKQFCEMVDQKEIAPEDVSIRGLYEGFTGRPAEDTIHAFQAGQRLSGISYRMPMSRREEIGSTMFPVATGALIAAKVIKGYELVNSIGDKLVTNMPSKHKVETMVGFTAVDGPQVVGEGKEYEGSDIGEKFVTMQAQKRGRLIGITEEMILFDQTGDLLRRAQGIGKKMRLDKEKRILKAVTGNNALTYRPQGVAASIYSAGNANLKTANALADWSNIDAILQTIAAQTDEKGDVIVIEPRQLLVPRALLGTGLRITRSTAIRTQSQGTTLAPVQTYGDAPFAGMFDPMSSPLLDSLSATGKTDWWLGDFPEAFVYQEIFPLETLAAIAGNPDEFKRDIKFLFKVREYGDVGCVDPRHVYQSTSA